MDPKTAFSLAKLVEVGTKGEKAAFSSYVRQLEQALRDCGEVDVADRIAAASKPNTAKRASVTRVERPLPVDNESRMPVADECIIEAPVQISLSAEVRATVDRFLSCIRHAEQLSQRGVSAPSTLLMHGPPGCGKTLLARYIANELALPLLTARSDSLISSYLGSTSKNVRSLFEHASTHRCVLFLDEFDALAKMRDDDRELGELKRVVISLLQNIDANGRNYILLAATNHSHLLDPAVWRRFSYRVEIGPPNEIARREMLAEFLGEYVDADAMSILATMSDGLTGSQLRDSADDAIRDAVIRGLEHIDLKVALQLVAERSAGSRVSDEDVIRMAKNRGGKDLSQTRLSELFNLSQPTVSRILNNGNAT